MNQGTGGEANKTIDKLAKICGMLGSAHDGERASAALLATQILDDLDVTWRNVIERAFSASKPAASVDMDERNAGWHVGYCAWLINNKGDTLSKWDMDFLTSLTGRYASIRLTQKQADCLTRICHKNGVEL